MGRPRWRGEAEEVDQDKFKIQSKPANDAGSFPPHVAHRRPYSTALSSPNKNCTTCCRESCVCRGCYHAAVLWPHGYLMFYSVAPLCIADARALSCRRCVQTQRAGRRETLCRRKSTATMLFCFLVGIMTRAAREHVAQSIRTLLKTGAVLCHGAGIYVYICAFRS